MRTGAVSQEQEQVARHRVETYVRAMFAIKGLGQPDPQLMHPMVDRAVSLLSTNEVRHPDSISLASLGDIQTLVSATQNQKSANIYGADAPAAGKDGSNFEKVGLKGIEALAAARAGTLLRNGGESGDNSRSAASSRIGGDYQVLDLSSPQGLQHLSAIGWGSTAASLPFARAGLSFGTVKDLRNYDRNFTGQDVLKASGDVKQLGFEVNDKRAMRNHATIRHYDNDADATNEAERKFKHSVDNDTDLQDLLRRRGLCTKPAEQKALDAQIAEHTKQHVHNSGLDQRINDPKNHPKARAAIKDDVDHIVHYNRQEQRAEHKAAVGAGTSRSDSDLKSAHKDDEPAIARAQDKNVAFKKVDVATLSAATSDAFGLEAEPAASAKPAKGSEPKAAEPKKPATKIADAKSAGPKAT